MKNLPLGLMLIFFFSCGGGSGGSGESASLPTPEVSTEVTSSSDETVLRTLDNEIIRTRIAATRVQQTRGLQGVRPSEFGDDEGMLFFYKSDKTRTFWMPNTYFNLDLFYLDKNLKITNIVWNLSHYTGDVDSEIPRAPAIKSRHVLEMKAGSRISSGLEVGDKLVLDQGDSEAVN